MFLAVMAFYYFLKNYPIPKEIFKPIAFLLLFIFSVLFSILVNGNADYFLFGIILGVLFIISIAPYALLSRFKGREIEIIKFIVYAGLINAIFLIGMFLFSDFKIFYISLLSKIDLLDVKGQDAIDSLYSMRLIGLTGSATYGMAVTQITIAMLYVFYVYEIKRGFRFYNYLALFLLILSAVISGRTAFLGLFFFINIYFEQKN